ncbi:hypothetical protein LINPERPRIM_LOCUS2860, partial [Linum perenne]
MGDDFGADSDDEPLIRKIKRKRTGESNNVSLNNAAGDLKATKRVRKPAAALVSPYTAEGKKKVCMDKCEVRSLATVRIPTADNKTEEIEIELTALMEYFKDGKDE